MQHSVNCKCLLPPSLSPRSIHREIGPNFTLEHSGTQTENIGTQIKEQIRTFQAHQWYFYKYSWTQCYQDQSFIMADVQVDGNKSCEICNTRWVFYFWDLQTTRPDERWIRGEIVFLILPPPASMRWSGSECSNSVHYRLSMTPVFWSNAIELFTCNAS